MWCSCLGAGMLFIVGDLLLVWIAVGACVMVCLLFIVCCLALWVVLGVWGDCGLCFICGVGR